MMTRRMVMMGLIATAIVTIGGQTASADLIYGITDNGRIAQVDTATKTETFLTGAQGYGGNGVALDLPGNRLLYRLPSTEQGLHALDLTTNAVTPISITGLPGESASASSSQGVYYYVAQGTDDFYKVTISGSTGTAVKLADFTNNKRGFTFGDIAIANDGTLYGSASQGFFKFDISNPAGTYTLINSTTPQLQITMLSNGQLIGQTHAGFGSYAAGQWFNVGTDGSYSAIAGFRTTPLRDIASNAVPEPASMTMVGIGVGAALAFARRRIKGRA